MDATLDQNDVLARTETIVPSALGIPAEKVTTVDVQAAELATQIVADPGNVDLLAQIQNLGIQTETRAYQKIELLEPMIKEGMRDIASGQPTGIAKIEELRLKTDPLSPRKAIEPTKIDQFLSLIPFLKLIPAVRAARRYAFKYESYEESLQHSLNDYQEGTEDVLRDSIDVKKTMEDLQVDMVPVRSNAYLAEMTLQALKQTLATTTDPVVQRELLKFVYHSATRARDLRSTEAALESTYDSLATTYETQLVVYNNMRRVIGPFRAILRVGLISYLAQKKLGEAMEVTEYIQDMATEMAMGAAKTAAEQKVMAAKLQAKPIFALAKIQEMFDIAAEATVEANRIILETIPLAEAEAKAFLQNTEASRQRREGIALPATSTITSIEAH